jgi:hypothetical protein
MNAVPDSANYPRGLSLEEKLIIIRSTFSLVENIKIFQTGYG